MEVEKQARVIGNWIRTKIFIPQPTPNNLFLLHGIRVYLLDT
jgi:hypothetical protein